jgi:microcystin-dependent protein
MIKEISGKLQWYQSPSVSLETLSTARFTTGDVKLTIKTVADPGWVLMNDGTIGNAVSGATTRANADTEALFTLLWNNTTDANCPVSGGRGASAAADFAANKTIALPKALGRALAVYGSGAGLTNRSLAQALGSEDATLVSHTHTATVNDPGHAHKVLVKDVQAGAGGGIFGVNGAFDIDKYTESAGTGISVDISTAGSSGSQANMQPTVFLNVMIKL